ncbi:hypothetical protein Plav_0328 [Parvibaculum lavamentivorans DS-1]|uniref:O-methyltransferase-like protein n=1 Tax=Parvibaculum lavamentivorans (strain DS-1 / DSM 13023 / NCIMB 13966) TaxID=402881 RepID=A7HPW8_PARL1|nr:class I SAM-dependent methyltransferase [Parvibaculum lavamentivorans]ABS61951.1 hypothetical protein Plav_0328 [Parvibaculum lavamentivorans DS-1]
MELPEKIAAMHADLDSIWPTGRNPECLPNDGGHFTLKGYTRPVSIGRIEAFLLFNLVRVLNIRTAFEIGTGFGYSSFWIAAGVIENDKGGWVGSIDSQQEGGLGVHGLDFARRWSNIIGLDSVLHFFTGKSPDDLSHVIREPLGLAFIDGNHYGEQPVLDYTGLQPHLLQDGILVWHDIEKKYGVNAAIAASIKDGWSLVTFPTSCRIGVSYRTLAGWQAATEAFSAARNLQIIH